MMASKWFKRQYRDLTIEVASIIPSKLFASSQLVDLYIKSGHAGTMRIEMTREQMQELIDRMTLLLK